MPEATHRVYSISRWDAKSAVVVFHEGHYADEEEPDGSPRRQFVRTRKIGDRVYTFTERFTEAGLRELLDDELDKHGALPSVIPQVRKRRPVLSAKAVNVRSQL
ncbi:hypothetical protein HN766_20360 [Candidatus Poribacteria bacterium]|jgi:hypothetical protein|nr:hypothetical protein [Candidatus Poribacteria bacterium]